MTFYRIKVLLVRFSPFILFYAITSIVQNGREFKKHYIHWVLLKPVSGAIEQGELGKKSITKGGFPEKSQ